MNHTRPDRIKLEIFLWTPVVLWVLGVVVEILSNV